MRKFILTLLILLAGCTSKDVPVAPFIQTVDEPTQAQQTTPVTFGESFALTVILESNMPHTSFIYGPVVAAKMKWESVIVEGKPSVFGQQVAQLNVPELMGNGITRIDDIAIVV